MPRFTIIRGVLLAAVLVLALPGAAKSATFGANVAGLFPPGYPPAASAVGELQALRSIGATVARSDSFWDVAEAKPPVNGVHTYDWAYDDAVMSTFAQVGLRWQPIIDYATWWSANSGGGINAGVSPARVGDYAAYAGAFAARYGDGGAFWAQHPSLPPDPVKIFEIWNEPDLNMFWGPEPDLAEYATMFLDARAAIRAVEPDAKVIIGGLVDPGLSLPEILAARPDLTGNVDGIGIHPYRPTADLTLASVANDVNVDAATLRVPLYVNEWGWESDPMSWQGATEAVRDAETEQVAEQLGRDPFVADVEPYCWGCSGAFNIYGSPAATAFALGIAAASPALKSQSTSPPVISGTPTVGKVLSTSPGSWSGTPPLLFSYQWQRCKPDCANIPAATSSSYTLPAGDVGAKLRVVVTASNSGGSAQSPSSQIGPLAPSPAQIKAQLLKQLSPAGKSATISLLKNGRYTFSFKTLGPGRVLIEWYYAPTGAKVGNTTNKAKPLLAATGKASFTKAGPVKLTMKLTPSGKRKLKAVNRLKLTAKATYTTSGSRGVVATKTFTLRR